MANDGPLKVMYLNPVGTPDCDGVFADMARGVKLPGTEVHVTSLKPTDGAFTHIEYRSYEAVVSAGIVRAARTAAAEGFDALAIGCFYDTALLEAREVSGDMVVAAPCAASLETAASVANRFGIIVGRRTWVHQMNATVRDNGMAERLSGFYPVELGVRDFQAVAARLGINQENVSRLEQRSDLLISTLSGYVEAMGGKLNLVAEFPDRPPITLTGIAALDE